MRYLSLFSGIGGMDLGLQWAGWDAVAVCEIDAFCRRALSLRFPEARIFSDIKDVNAEQFQHLDAIVGGFPCQDASNAGKKAGLKEGNRTGLWLEMARLIRALRPRFVLGENVSGILHRGADIVLRDLEDLGYTCWPVATKSGLHVGAPHRRERVFFVAMRNDVAHTDGGRQQQRQSSAERLVQVAGSGRELLADSAEPYGREFGSEALGRGGRCADVANSNDNGRERRALSDGPRQEVSAAARISEGRGVADTLREQPQRDGGPRDMGHASGDAGGEARQQWLRDALGAGGEALADSDGAGWRERCWAESVQQEYAALERTSGPRGPGPSGDWPMPPGPVQHEREPPRLVERQMGADADGLPCRLAGPNTRGSHRRAAIKGAGNAVVPQAAFMMGQLINMLDKEFFQ